MIKLALNPVQTIRLSSRTAGASMRFAPSTAHFTISLGWGSINGIPGLIDNLGDLVDTGIIVQTDASHSVAARTLQAPAAGFTITNPAGIAGDPTFVLANDLAALEGLSSTGLIARTADGTASARTLTGPAAGISVADGDGVAGNPTLSLANDLSALEGLGSTGIAVRSAADTWVQRTITGTANEITVGDGDGVAANPTISIPSGFIIPGTITIPNTGLHILDTDSTHDLIIAPGSNLTADHTLTITTGDADRTVTLSGNPTLSDWFDQAVKQASSPTFAAVTVGNTGLTVGASVPFSDAAGSLTLQNIDVIDATTETTIESAIDTLANLTSVQGLTVTLTDAGADAFLGWDDTASAYENLTAAEAKAILGYPTSTTDNTVPRFDLTAGNIQTSGVSIDDSNNLTVPGTITVTGGQVAFPATQNASADANTLDDYEEGTWTPVATFVTLGDLSVVYSTQAGWYTKIGREVFIGFAISCSTFTYTTSAGEFRITGAPFAAGTAANNNLSTCTTGGISKASYVVFFAQIQTSVSYFRILATAQGLANSAVTTSDLPTAAAVNLASNVRYSI